MAIIETLQAGDLVDSCPSALASPLLSTSRTVTAAAILAHREPPPQPATSDSLQAADKGVDSSSADPHNASPPVSLAGRGLEREVTWSSSVDARQSATSTTQHQNTGTNRRLRREQAKKSQQMSRQHEVETRARDLIRKRSQQRHLLKGQPFEYRHDDEYEHRMQWPLEQDEMAHQLVHQARLEQAAMLRESERVKSSQDMIMECQAERLRLEALKVAHRSNPCHILQIDAKIEETASALEHYINIHMIEEGAMARGLPVRHIWQPEPFLPVAAQRERASEQQSGHKGSSARSESDRRVPFKGGNRSVCLTLQLGGSDPRVSDPPLPDGQYVDNQTANPVPQRNAPPGEYLDDRDPSEGLQISLHLSEKLHNIGLASEEPHELPTPDHETTVTKKTLLNRRKKAKRREKARKSISAHESSFYPGGLLGDPIVLKSSEECINADRKDEGQLEGRNVVAQGPTVLQPPRRMLGPMSPEGCARQPSPLALGPSVHYPDGTDERESLCPQSWLSSDKALRDEPSPRLNSFPRGHDDTLAAHNGHSTPEELLDLVDGEDSGDSGDHDVGKPPCYISPGIPEHEHQFLMQYMEHNRSLFAAHFLCTIRTKKPRRTLYLPGGVIVRPLSPSGASQVIGLLDEDHPGYIPIDCPRIGIVEDSGDDDDDTLTDDGYQPSVESNADEASSDEVASRLLHAQGRGHEGQGFSSVARDIADCPDMIPDTRALTALTAAKQAAKCGEEGCQQGVCSIGPIAEGALSGTDAGPLSGTDEGATLVVADGVAENERGQSGRQGLSVDTASHESARVHLRSNKPGNVRASQVVYEGEENTLNDIGETAPLARYAGTEHGKLTRTQVARSLRSRQSGGRLTHAPGLKHAQYFSWRATQTSINEVTQSGTILAADENGGAPSDDDVALSETVQ
ncbi:unnamed protein product [Parajaminaea phylloscopi]